MLNIINYNEIENKINRLISSKVCLEEIIIDQEKIKKELKKYGYKNTGSKTFTSFRKIEIDNKFIYIFKSLDQNKTNMINNIVVVNQAKRKPIFDVSMTENKNYIVKYSDEYLISYDDNGYIDSKLRLKTFNTKDTNSYTITTLTNNERRGRNYQNQCYTLTEVEDEIISFSQKDKMYLKNEFGFNIRLDTAMKSLNTVSNRIESKLDDIIKNEKVKIYTVKRKQQH